MRLTADRTGLTTALLGVLRRDGFVPGHGRGRVLTDTAMIMANGGNRVLGIDVLRHQSGLPAWWPRRPSTSHPGPVAVVDHVAADLSVWGSVAGRPHAEERRR